MKVLRNSLLSGANGAQGIVVIIDVIRAFTCNALLFHYGIQEVRLVGTVEEALAIRAQDDCYLAAGEVQGIKPDAFDLGNSPKDIVEAGERFFRGRKVVYRSSAGTQGVLAAGATAREVILGSFLTAGAVARYLHRQDAADLTVTLVAMGYEGSRKSVEDELCADYIEHLLTGTPYDHLSAVWRYLTDPYVSALLRGERSYVAREDVVLAMQRDLLDFVITGRPEGPYVRARRIDL